MTMRTSRKILISWALVLLLPAPAPALTPAPAATAPSPAASPSATAPTATVTPPRPTTTPTKRPVPSATATAAVSDDDRIAPEEPQPAATAVAPRAARAFRTPERPAPPVFVPDGGGAPEAPAPDGDAPPAMAPAPRAPAARAGTALVVLRATARTAIEGFDVRVTYPRTLGQFATDGQQADCNAGTGTLVVASDRGTGEMRLLVAAAQALPLPLDVFCRFSVTGGGVDAGQFAARVAEVTVNGKSADTSLLIVNVVVR